MIIYKGSIYKRLDDETSDNFNYAKYIRDYFHTINFGRLGTRIRYIQFFIQPSGYLIIKVFFTKPISKEFADYVAYLTHTWSYFRAFVKKDNITGFEVQGNGKEVTKFIFKKAYNDSTRML